jgi:hypothetical protein
MHLPDHLQQATYDRQQARQASAAAHRFVGSSPARIRIARTLRRAADRLDAATSPSSVRSAHPGGSSQLPPGLFLAHDDHPRKRMLIAPKA